MKTTLFIPVVILAGACAAAGLDLQAKKDREFEAFIKREEAAAQAIYRVVEPFRIERKPFVLRGALPQAIKLGNPLALLNPFAPMEHGDGFANLVPPMHGDPAPKLAVLAIEF